jgi:hypothetical protein
VCEREKETERETERERGIRGNKRMKKNGKREK